jgi:hypothetical protein
MVLCFIQSSDHVHLTSEAATGVAPIAVDQTGMFGVGAECSNNGINLLVFPLGSLLSLLSKCHQNKIYKLLSKPYTGQNSVIIVNGANDLLTPAHIDAAKSTIQSAKVLLTQLEIKVACACICPFISYVYMHS